MLTYQNYHRHSCLTNPKISDSTVTNEDYAKRAVELGHGIISTMEHGYQGRYIEGYELAKKYNLKFVFGTEAYWVLNREEKDGSNCHICIFARNENGRQAINDILSEANISGFYKQARLDVDLILSLPADDVIVTTACVAYWKYDNIVEITKRFKDHFGKNFYLEVQYHNTPKQIELNTKILQLSHDLNIPIIMGCDSHYITEEQSQNRTDFLYSKGLEYPDEEGWYLDYPNGDEAYKRFANQCVLSHEQILEAMKNTEVFLEVEEYNNPCFNDEIKMPTLYPDKTQEEKDEIYTKVIWDSWNEYKKEVSPNKWDMYEEEIQKEIDVVLKTHTSDYFLINHQVIKKGKENGGWLTKTGRGSAVSFITNMLLGFTEVDRIAASVKMYPERFMSVERILESRTLPDIDFNVAYVPPFALAQKQILGEDQAYPMIAYGTMQVSAAWKLYAKSQDIPFEISNAVSEQIKKYETALKHAEEDEKDDIVVDDYIGKEYKEIFEKSKDYRGLITSWSIAPCSYLLYQGSIRKEIGLIKIKDHLCCLMDGHWAETGHFLKNDLLKVSVVDLIYRTFHKIGQEPPSVNELLRMCGVEDSCWDIYAKGCCMGINQCERSGTASRVAKYQPTNISMLCAFIAAIRPGFKSMYKVFESKQPFSYNVKAFDDLIQTEEMPMSFVLYQEQEMAALNYAGISMSECYTAIKNIAKKRKEKVLAYHDVFINGFNKAMIENEGKTPEEASKLSGELWQIIEDSASYSFNASHSYCVALDSLYGAWLKSHHPIAFYECLMQIQEEKGNKDKLNDAKSEAEDYFNVKFPPFRFGQDNRQITGDVKTNSINNSLSSIKNYSTKIAEVLYECSLQEHKTFMDVMAWLDKQSIKSAKVVPLIKIDYFMKFGNCAELLRINEMFDFFSQGSAKQIKKEKVKSEILKDIISRHATDKNKDGSESKSYTITDINAILNEVESYIKSLNLSDLSFKLKCANQNDILGYIDLTTNKPEDRQKLVVSKVVPLKNRTTGEQFANMLVTKSIGSGKNGTVNIMMNVFNANPVSENDVIHIKNKDTDMYQNKKGFWYLRRYEKIIM